MEPAGEERARPLRAFALRFGVVYWALHIFPFPLTAVPYLAYAGEEYLAGRAWLMEQIAAAASITIPAAPGMGSSSDRTIDWIWLAVNFAIALAGAGVWTIAARKPPRDRWRVALHTGLRYYLAGQMLLYAWVKILPSQFPANGPSQILATYAESSPMGMLWRFMGQSPVYAGFGGALEMVGALLLYARRTTALGAMVLAGVLVNVVLLNFCYDVPVKLGSMHLLAGCLVLLSPQLHALSRFFVLQRPAELASSPGFVAPPGRWRVAQLVAKGAFVLGSLGLTAEWGVTAWKQWGRGREPGPLEGIWEVETIEHGDACAERDPLLRWHRVSVDHQGFVTWNTDGKRGGWKMDYRPDAATLKVTYEKDGVSLETEPGGAPADAARFELHGDVRDKPARITLRRVPESEVVLESRGFHWVNESSYWR